MLWIALMFQLTDTSNRTIEWKFSIFELLTHINSCVVNLRVSCFRWQALHDGRWTHGVGLLCGLGAEYVQMGLETGQPSAQNDWRYGHHFMRCVDTWLFKFLAEKCDTVIGKMYQMNPCAIFFSDQSKVLAVWVSWHPFTWFSRR